MACIGQRLCWRQVAQARAGAGRERQRCAALCQHVPTSLQRGLGVCDWGGCARWACWTGCWR